MQAPLPGNEPERLEALRNYGILDTDAEAGFDDLARLAAQICGTPVALISLVDADRQWFKARVGFRESETPRDQGFCAHALHQPDLLVVPDAASDPRFAGNPLVVGGPRIKFYAGAPLVTDAGHALGTLCVLDTVPRTLRPDQQAALLALSRQVIARLDLRRLLAERAQGERARTPGEALESAILRSAPDCVITTDPQGLILEWNPAAARTFGRSREDALGRDLMDLIIPPPRAVHGRGLAGRLAMEGGPVPGERTEIRARRAGGGEFAAELAITPMLVEGRRLFTVYLRDISDRKRAEATLQAAHAELEAQAEQRAVALAHMQRQNELLLSCAGEGIYGIDAGGITQFVNPAGARMLGYEVAELIGRPMHALLLHTRPDGTPYPSWECPIYDAMRSGEASQVDDGVFWRKDGTTLDVAYTATPLREEGRLAGAVVTFQDVTKRRRTEESLRQRTQELLEALQEHRSVMEAVPDVLFRLDLQGRLVQWNRKMETVTGLTPAELQGRPALDFFGAAEQDKIAQAIGQALQAGYTEVEGGLLGAGGAPAPHQFSAAPVRRADGQVIGLTGMGRDIAERGRAETALRESEARYRGLVEHSPEAVVVYSEDRIVYANAAAARLFAAPRAADLTGRLIFDLVHPDNHALTRSRAARSQKEGKSSPLTQQKYVRLDGRVIDVEAVSTGISYQGRPAGQVLIRDITERKKAEGDILALNAELLHAYDATIEGWSRALDLRDHETEGHSRRVTEMTLRLARAVALPEAELVHVRRGALLHDIGKMGVPDRVLLKPGPLDDAEWEIMRRHPALAREMLSPTEFLRPALGIPYCHHEKWDGTGYPQCLRGEEIPLAARLFALVDVWDALSSDRPYRAAWPRRRVMDHLLGLAGTHFDPALVPVFLRLLEADSSRADARQGIAAPPLPGLRAA